MKLKHKKTPPPPTLKFVESHRCPECGAKLLTNGANEWCSGLGAPEREDWSETCDYGIEVRKPLGSGTNG